LEFGYNKLPAGICFAERHCFPPHNFEERDVTSDS